MQYSIHSNQQKVAKKIANSRNSFFYIRQYEISCNISTDYKSQNAQNKIYNFKIRLEQLTEAKKTKERTSLV